MTDQVVDGLWVARTKGTFPSDLRERAIAETWNAENEHQDIVQQSCMHPATNPLGGYMDGRKPVYVVTERERIIVATVIQWLGSNVGWCFVEDALRAAGYKLVKIDAP